MTKKQNKSSLHFQGEKEQENESQKNVLSP